MGNHEFRFITDLVWPTVIGVGLSLALLMAVIGTPRPLPNLEISHFQSQPNRSSCEDLAERVGIYSDYLESTEDPDFLKLEHLTRLSQQACGEAYQHCGFKPCP